MLTVLRRLSAFAVLGVVGAALAVVFGPPSASAASQSIYVSVDGSDSATGTEADPLRTINGAIRRVEAGDTIWVGAGVYDDQADQHNAVSLRVSGRPDAWITLMAMPGTRPEIRTTGRHGLQSWGNNYWHIEGFEFDGSFTNNNLSAGISFNNGAHHLRIVDNWVHDFRAGGIGGSKTDYIHIEGNRLWNNANIAPNQTSAISLYQFVAFDDEPGFHNVITGNYAYNNENLVPNPDSGRITDGNCIIIDDFRHTQSDSPYPAYEAATLITNNYCFDNGGRGVHIYLADNVHVANNTLFRNTRSADIDHGELSASSASQVTFVNNLVVSRAGAEPVHVRNATDITFRANAYVETNRAAPDLSERSFSLAEARLTQPSLDPDTIDLTPARGSPLVGLGVVDSNVSHDLSGRVRPAPPTVGALEPVDQPGGGGEVAGQVTTTSGRTPAVTVDLFAAGADGSRARFLRAGRTGDEGRYRLSVDAGCYVLVLIAPDGLTFSTGSRWIERSLCVTAGEVAAGPNGVVVEGDDEPSSIGDRVTYEDGAAAPDVSVDLFMANTDSSRAGFIRDTTTDTAGGYRFDVVGGCYVVVFIAPTGTAFSGGGAYDQQSVCLAAGYEETGVDAVLMAPAP